MRAFKPNLSRVRRSDVHVSVGEKEPLEQCELWMEADFTFEETLNDDDDDTVPPFFNQMALRSVGEPR